MVTFNRRAVPGSLGIGHHLKNARRALGLSIDEIAEATRIRKPLLLALERGSFYEIGEPFYRTLIIKTYVEYVGLDWCALQTEYERESTYLSAGNAVRNARPLVIQRSDLWVASRIVKNMALGSAFAGACAYIVFLAFVALRPPALTVESPANNYESSSSTIVVRGATAAESDIQINGQRVLKRGDGSFEQKVTLSEGANVIRVAAAKKYSKESVVTRTVVYRELRDWK
jgi:cytoskeletal protein RodZ